MQIIQRPVHTFNRGRYFDGVAVEPHAVIIHWSAGGGNDESLAKYLDRPTSNESYHYGIGRPGTVSEYVAPYNTAWATGDGKIPAAEVETLHNEPVPISPGPRVRKIVNATSIAIAICNRGFAVGRATSVGRARHRNPASRSTIWEAYTDEALDSLTQLLRMLVARFPTLALAMGHEDATNQVTLGKIGAKVDPGPLFPWELVRACGLGIVRTDYANKCWIYQRPL